MLRIQTRSLLIGLVFCASVCGQDRIDFSRDIQPILSENCYFCHGPDPRQREAGLRLDLEEDALDWFEPGEPEESELFLRISTQDKSELMPPASSHRELTGEQIEKVRLWIQQGGKWGEHWSFAPLNKEPLDTAKPSDAIDVFIQRKLLENELDFSPQADRRALIRRVSIDLTGLPPTPEQLDEFLSDQSSTAYERMVERFLASPAYGERMAWDWLDAARYADTNGYQGDNERTMWPWRDWVVKAFNENMPFDEFSSWQLAGDLMPNASPEQTLATAFLRNHPINGEGGRIPEENRIDYVMDMAETTGTVWMGLTFNCCRCHDHKYDQLSQKDYYSLFAFFNQTPVDGGGGNAQTPPVLAVPNELQKQKQIELKSKIALLQSQLQLLEEELKPNQADWETAELTAAEESAWQSLVVESCRAEQAKLEVQSDRSVLSGGANPDNDIYHLVGKSSLKSIRGIRLEALLDPSMTEGGLARSNSSNFVLTEFEVFVVDGKSERNRVEIVRAIADYEQAGFSIEFAFDGNPDSGWAVLKPRQDPHRAREAVFEFANPIVLDEASHLEVFLKHESIHAKHNIGRFRLSLTENVPELAGNKAALIGDLKVKPEVRTAEQSKHIRSAFLETDTQYVALMRRIADAQDRLDQLSSRMPKVMVMGDTKALRKTFMLNRGSYQEPRDEVFARVPSILGPLPKEASADRLTLANWLFDESNPLTSRVAINRMWAQVFGIGLVKTTEDFGVQGEPPSHPELLDWLAIEFRESGWDVKHMWRLILNSRTYRQSSKVNGILLEQDPENRLLGRAPRYRMPSWMIRDYALEASGRLVPTRGGPPVNSYQPAGVWEEASFGNKTFQLGTGDEVYRRSIYTFWRRIAAPTMFFDNADRMTCSVKSFRTNTPLHALTTLNGVTYVEASRLLATRAMEQESEFQDRLALVYERLLARNPTSKESEILLSALKRTKSQYGENPLEASRLIGLGQTPAPEDLNAIELASWTSLCLAVLNLDETLSRQ